MTIKWCLALDICVLSEGLISVFASMFTMLHHTFCDRDEADKSRRATVDRSKQRRKKSEKLPRLKILGMENGGEVVECLLESGKHSTVVFKFSPDVDKTDDIADSLVGSFLCVLHGLFLSPPSERSEWQRYR